MKCPHCRWPMHLGRYVPGQYKVFHCEPCKRRLSRKYETVRRTGFNGSLVMNPRIPLVHQEVFA